ncbi:MAG: DNA repair protein RecO [Patescibacteria group bacterium]|nr:DNA repair protein RecO [Patescibacteria group bacterium]MCL5431711.1 DNA repair protein RecO [Patescibacteria group bacterium]
MLNSSKIEGVILKRSNLGEADKIIIFFSRQLGKTKVLAKGVRRIRSRRAPDLELFNHVSLVVHHSKTFNLVTEAKTINNYSLLKSDLKSSGYLFYLCEVLDKILPEDQPHPDLFGNFLAFLNSPLNQDGVKRFVVELLWSLGYLPRGQYPRAGVTDLVESIVERPIRSKKFLEEI